MVTDSGVEPGRGATGEQGQEQNGSWRTLAPPFLKQIQPLASTHLILWVNLPYSLCRLLSPLGT